VSYVLLPGGALVELQSTPQLFPGGLLLQELSDGDQTLSAGLVASGLTHYSPSFSVADITVSAGLVASGLSFFTPTFTYHDITMPLVASGLTIYGVTFTVPASTTGTVRLLPLSLDALELAAVQVVPEVYSVNLV
jgi:hypothetical protein